MHELIGYDVIDRDVKRSLENRILVLETKSGSTSSTSEILIYSFFVIFVKEITQNYQMSGKINSHICLMFSV